jgi:histone-lysine N-methyltransferase SUV420H
LSIYLPDCPFEVNTTNRYTIVSHEAAVTARRFIKRNETIKHLSGVQVVITPEEEKEMTARKKDFSIVVSSRNKCASLFMGPARFANHDCNANAKLVTTGKAGIEIIAIRNIEVGEEITVTYADNYFGVNNSECLCCTCEKNQANGWANPEGQVSVKTSIEGATGDGYSLRKRRRADSSERASRTPSVAPSIRPQVSKTRLKSARNSLANDSAAKDSTTTDSPMPPPSSTKKRAYSSSIMTPPFTPAKKLKLAADQAIPIHLDAQSSRSSSVQSERSDSLASGNGSTTDITEPEKESPCPEAQTLKAVQTQTDMPVLKQEEGDERAGTILAQTSLFSQTSEAAQAAAPAPAVVATTRPVSAMSISAICNPPTPPSSQPLPSTEEEVMATVETTEPVTDPAPLIVKVEAKIEASAEDAAAEEPEQPRKKRKYTRRMFIKETTPPARHRQPGDYTLTPLLLSEPLMAWIRCINCDTAFVQHNAYYTKSSCPRCERHSKLYGYIWPKTQKAGPRDKEERILDHRTIHRFLNRQDEAIIRGRAIKRPLSDVDTTATATETATPDVPMRKKRKMTKRNETEDESEDEAEDDGDRNYMPTRRSGRARRVSNKASAVA